MKNWRDSMATVAENLQTIKDSVDAIKQSIIDKGGTISGGLTTYADAIRNITGGDASQESDMPIIGDGKTYLYIKVEDELNKTVKLSFGYTGTLVIDYGDGTSQTMPNTTSLTSQTITHTYEEIGDYVISFNSLNSGVLRLGMASSTSCIMGAVDNYNKAVQNMLRKVEIGSNMTSIAASSFRLCTSLSAIHIPNTVNLIDGNAFYNCYSLQKITIPDSVSTIMNTVFGECYSLQEITMGGNIKTLNNYVLSNCRSIRKIILPEKLTTIKTNAFNNCYSLSSLVIPSGVTSIGASAFNNCYCIKLYDFSQCITVPTLENTNAFTGISSDCRIIVPGKLYYEWIAATNWSTYASYIIYKGSTGGGHSGGAG